MPHSTATIKTKRAPRTNVHKIRQAQSAKPAAKHPWVRDEVLEEMARQKLPNMPREPPPQTQKPPKKEKAKEKQKPASPPKMTPAEEAKARLRCDYIVTHLWPKFRRLRDERVEHDYVHRVFTTRDCEWVSNELSNFVAHLKTLDAELAHNHGEFMSWIARHNPDTFHERMREEDARKAKQAEAKAGPLGMKLSTRDRIRDLYKDVPGATANRGRGRSTWRRRRPGAEDMSESEDSDNIPYTMETKIRKAQEEKLAQEKRKRMRRGAGPFNEVPSADQPNAEGAEGGAGGGDASKEKDAEKDDPPDHSMSQTAKHALFLATLALDDGILEWLLNGDAARGGMMQPLASREGFKRWVNEVVRPQVDRVYTGEIEDIEEFVWICRGKYLAYCGYVQHAATIRAALAEQEVTEDSQNQRNLFAYYFTPTGVPFSKQKAFVEKVERERREQEYNHSHPIQPNQSIYDHLRRSADFAKKANENHADPPEAYGSMMSSGTSFVPSDDEVADVTSLFDEDP